MMQRVRILIVEDDKVLTTELRRVLGRRGYEITGTLARGEDAVPFVDQDPPDLILMDIVLAGDMDGIEASNSIRARHRIPVIFMTASTDEEFLDRAKKTEPYAFLLKPFRGYEIYSCIETVMVRSRLEKKLQESDARHHDLVRSLEAALREKEHLIGEIHRRENEIIDISERERIRIGQDLHDDIGQYFTGISFLLNAVLRQLTGQDEPELPAARELNRLVDEAKSHVRLMMEGLCPVKNIRNGLHVALEELCARIGKTFDIPCRLRYDQSITVPEEPVATHLYFIAQEAINNAVKHGNARCITVSFEKAGGSLLLTVEDDGAGIGTRKHQHASFGLDLMKYRADIIGAELDIRPGVPVGTAVRVRLAEQAPR